MLSRTLGDALNQWDIKRTNDPAVHLNFQTALNEGTNTIDFVYNAMVTPGTGYYPAVGIANWDGSMASAVCASARRSVSVPAPRNVLNCSPKPASAIWS